MRRFLITCMGFGCNAAGVIGCRIIDSPRERLIAILTNSFIPCNGRFPGLILLIGVFFFQDSFYSVLLLTGLILLSAALSLAASRLLSATVLRGVPSSFTLELPPYRRPQIGRVLIRSLLDRTLFVLGRAVCVAAPAGAIIWILANCKIGGNSLLFTCAAVLDAPARFFGLDGVILLAFILGFPANEIVLPIAVMTYLAEGSLIGMGDPAAMHCLLTAQGWTPLTALCVMLFSLMHWPCSTTLLTIWHETKSVGWSALAFFLPTGFGLFCCAIAAQGARLLGLA